MELSIIIPRSPEAILTMEWCKQQLGGLNYEIIIRKDWRRGLAQAKGEFVCFLEKDCVFSPNYFVSLLDVYKERPSFRKLAMVAPTLGVESWKNKVYGYHLELNKLVPIKDIQSSSPHFCQVVYVPGALIRRSAINDMAPSLKDVMLDSFNFSAYFWGNGNMVIMHPNVTYVSADDTLDLAYIINEPGDYEVLSKMFRREMVGQEVDE